MSNKTGVPFRARHGAKFFWILTPPALVVSFLGVFGVYEKGSDFLWIAWLGLAFGWAQEMYERGRTDGALSAWSRFNKMIDEAEKNDRP